MTENSDKKLMMTTIVVLVVIILFLLFTNGPDVIKNYVRKLVRLPELERLPDYQYDSPGNYSLDPIGNGIYPACQVCSGSSIQYFGTSAEQAAFFERFYR